MRVGINETSSAKSLGLLPLLIIVSLGIVWADGPSYTITSNTINSGGRISSSSNYSARYSLGPLASGSLTSTSYSIQANALSIPDTDADGVLDNIDNCPSIFNSDQLNSDTDLLGNACDLDDDNDGLSDITEASIGTDPLLADTDGDGLADGDDPNPLIRNADGDLAPYGAPDGIINAADLIIAQQIVLGVITPTAEDIIHADVYPAGSPDGVIDMSDLLLIRQLVLPQP